MGHIVKVDAVESFLGVLSVWHGYIGVVRNGGKKAESSWDKNVDWSRAYMKPQSRL